MTARARAFTAYIQRDAETGDFVGIIPGVPGAHTAGETIEELERNLKEVLELCLEELGEDEIDESEFVEVRRIELTA